MSDFLTLHTEDGSYPFRCPVNATLTLGSAEDCDITLDGEGITEHHLLIQRLGEGRFLLSCFHDEQRVTVNGVSASELEVETPFRMELAGDGIDFSITPEPPVAAAPRRRDYLLGLPRQRLRSSAPPMPLVESSQPTPARKHAIEPPPMPAPPPPTVNHVHTLRSVSGNGDASAIHPPPPETDGWWVFAVLIGLLAPAGIYFAYDFLNAPDAVVVQPRSAPVPPPPPVVIAPPKAVPKAAVPAPLDSNRKDATAAAKAFLDSWNESDASGVLKHVSPAPASFFEMPNPASDAVLRMEEEWRAHWPERTIRATGEMEARRASESRFELVQGFEFELRGLNGRLAAGTGKLNVTLERVAPKTWLVIQAADPIELGRTVPTRREFSPALSLRQLKPVLTAAELKKQTMEELIVLTKATDAKAALTAILKSAAEFPQDTFWRFATDEVCNVLSRRLFAEGHWEDASCADEVKKLSELGVTSAILLHGHLLRSGYALPRNVAEGEALYRRAYETVKSRESRFYYAEALFIGGEYERASAIALATMTSSQHPLEAYLAAHLLWKKAELDPSLWQQVYETAARAATRHPPAKNLAGLVLLKHGNTTKERQAGFALIQKAAEDGVVEAMKNLIACHEYGDGCPRDPAEAQKWKIKAANSPPPAKRHYSEFEG